MDEKEIKESGDQIKEPTVSILKTVQQKGLRKIKREVEFFNSDAISGHSFAQTIYLKTDTKKSTTLRADCLN
jgi:hypothetical protein